MSHRVAYSDPARCRLRDDWDLRFALRFALRVAEPGLRYTAAEDDDGRNAWLHDGEASWAVIAEQKDGTTIASRGGPRRPADLLDRAWGEWTRMGSPGRYEYGLTVTPDQQYAWALEPGTGPHRHRPPARAVPAGRPVDRGHRPS
ncbi:hypothetical protein ACWDR0_03590 [Streptomyces sp. NPDC003691]